MGEINELRRRVEAAEERFGLIKEEQSKYSQRLIDLIARLENDLQTLRAKSESNEEEVTRLNFQNEELRSMLHSLLLSIESNSFDSTLRSLDSRIAAMIQGSPEAVAPAETAPPVEDAATELTAEAVETAAEAEEVADEVAAEVATLEAEASETDIEAALEDAEIDIPEVMSEPTADTDFGEEGGAVDEGMTAAASEAMDGEDEEIALVDDSDEESASGLSAEESEVDVEAEIAAVASAIEDAVAGMNEPTEELELVDSQEPGSADTIAEELAAVEEVELAEPEVVAEAPVSEDAVAEEPVAETTIAEEQGVELQAGENQPEGDILLDAPAASSESGEEEEPSVKDIIKRVSALVRDLAEDDATEDAAAGEADTAPETGSEASEKPMETVSSDESGHQSDILNLIDDGEDEPASLAAS